MEEKQNRPPVAVAFEHMTGPSRGALTWLSASTLDVTQDANCLLNIDEAKAGSPPDNLVARLHRHENTYELQAPDDRNVWVNGNRVATAKLKNGDTVEFGDSGPMCRVRFYSDHTPVRPSVAEILSDVYAYLKSSRQPILKRAYRAVCALFGRLTHESSLFFRLTLLIAIVGFGILAYQQYRLNERLQQDIDSAAMRLASISADVVNARKEALRPSDLEELRDSLQQRVTSNLSPGCIGSCRDRRTQRDAPLRHIARAPRGRDLSGPGP